jgi:hypothetical protein
MQPTFNWYLENSDEISIEEDSPYTIIPGIDIKSSTLNIDPSRYNSVQTITCKVTFDGITEYLQTSTSVHFRGRQMTKNGTGNR